MFVYILNSPANKKRPQKGRCEDWYYFAFYKKNALNIPIFPLSLTFMHSTLVLGKSDYNFYKFKFYAMDRVMVKNGNLFIMKRTGITF